MMTTDVSYPHTRLRLIDKLVLLAVLAIAVALFLSIGWLAIAPDDPHGAVSLITRRHAGLMVVQAAALTAVTASIATIMMGCKLADVGVFASALGLALVTLRGDTATYLLINVAQGDRSLERVLAGKLAVEGVIWFVVLVVAMAFSGLVTRWCFGAGRRPGGDTHSPPSPPVTLADLSVSECPLMSSLAGGVALPSAAPRSRWAGLRATAVTTVVAIFVFSVLVSGSSPRAIEHGQIWFAVFSAFYLGVWVSKRTFPSRTAFWNLLATPAACVVGYLWTMVAGGSAGRYAHLASVPPSDFLRALPMTFIAVGALGVLLAHWTITESVAKPKPTKAKSKRSLKR